jgi:hypothetical protein
VFINAKPTFLIKVYEVEFSPLNATTDNVISWMKEEIFGSFSKYVYLKMASSMGNEMKLRKCHYSVKEITIRSDYQNASFTFY